MASYYTILTAIGQAKIANAVALGQKVNLSTMAVGDAHGVTPQPDSNMKGLISEKRRAPLNRVELDKDNPNFIVCEQVLPPDVGGWSINEVGIFDSDGNMIAYGNFPPTYKPVLSEGTSRTQTIRIALQVSDTAAVTLKVDPSVVLATRQYVDDSSAALQGKLKTGAFATVFDDNKKNSYEDLPWGPGDVVSAGHLRSMIENYLKAVWGKKVLDVKSPDGYAGASDELATTNMVAGLFEWVKGQEEKQSKKIDGLKLGTASKSDTFDDSKKTQIDDLPWGNAIPTTGHIRNLLQHLLPVWDKAVYDTRDAWAFAGSSNELVTTNVIAGLRDWVTSSFSSHLAGDGWQKIQGGLIIQWGRVYGNTTAEKVAWDLRFPISFPNACWMVIPSFMSPGNYGSDVIKAWPTGLQTWQARRDTANSMPFDFNWIALGY